MIFIYEFYIDVYMAQNFLMNLTVLALTDTLCRCQVRLKRTRMILAAAVGAIAGALLVLMPPGYVWAMPGQAFLVVPGMLLLAFGYHGKRDVLRRLLVSWFSIVVLNGVAEAVYNLAGISLLSFYGAVLVLFVSKFLVKLARASLERQSRIYPVTLSRGPESVRCLGLYDTGNLLTVDGEPVHIVSSKLLERMGLLEDAGLRLIPYRALGSAQGWIGVVKIERLKIGDGNDARCVCGAWLGCAEPELFLGKSYQMILNGMKGVMT